MANEPQGTLTYGSVVGQLSANYTRSNGITPGVIAISIPPTPTLSRMANAIWAYDGDFRTMINCALDDIKVSRTGGQTVWNVTIRDRRWTWADGHITGEYNIPKPGSVVPMREKTPQELATLCLDAMGQDAYGYTITALPNTARPYVKWDISNPAKMLADLLEDLGCVLVYNWDESVTISQNGVGAALPNLPSVLSNDDGVQPLTLPKNLVFFSAPTRWQRDFELVAIGKDTDGAWKLLADLSYNPDPSGDGFGIYDPQTFSGLGTDEEIKLAKETVWRYYAIKRSGFSMDLSPASEDPVTDIGQIRPLIAEQVETEEDEAGEKVNKPAVVYGKFSEPHGAGTPNVATFNQELHANPKLKYEGGFSIDEKRGWVIFSDPVFILESGSNAPADLKLRCSVNYHDADTRGAYRATKTVEIDPTSPSGARPIYRDDVEHLIYTDDTDTVVNNIDDVETQADYYLNEAIRNLQPQASGTASYAGFQAIAMDGAIGQVTFSINEGKAMTVASRNTEHSLETPSYKQRRKAEKLTATLKEREKQKLRADRDRRITERRIWKGIQ